MRVFSNTQEGLEILCAICLIRSLVAVQVKRLRSVRAVVAFVLTVAARQVGPATINGCAVTGMAIS